MADSRLEVEIYQIVDDSMMKPNRTDGTGWEWGWADWQRDWMNATPHRYAYRCLPLTIVNQTGWWIRNPVGFNATWRGPTAPGSIDFQFDTAAGFWQTWINSQFGEGIITWNTPFLFRTKPAGSRLLICGPPNYFKQNMQPLTALIESDWVSMSFTMNWKIMVPNQPVRFEQGEPLFQAIPLISNVCADLESAEVSYQKLTDNPDLHRAYREWDQGRRKFHDQKASGEVNPTDWQKDYFQGRDAVGRESGTYHMTKVKPPRVRGIPTPTSSPAPASSGGQGGPTPRSTERAPEKVGARDLDRARAPVASVSADDLQNQRLDWIYSQPHVAVVMMGQTDVLEEDEDEFDDEQQGAAEEGWAGEVSSNEAADSVEEVAVSHADDDWRRWIAENLIVGQLPDNVFHAMTASGFSAEEAAFEINAALQSPYIKGSELLLNRLKKRDWLLAVYRKSNRLHPQSAEIERRHKLSRDEFLREYYSTNRPVIITGMMEDWPAMRKWNLDYFAERFGDRVVEVQMGRIAGANYEIEREKYIQKIRFGDFVEKVRTAGQTNDFYLTANNSSANRQILPELWDDIVQIPEYLSADQPGGFFWFGPAGTITPFHHDLTNNFMAQVIGRKRIKVAPSWDLPAMHNHKHCFSLVDGRVAPAAPHPGLEEPQILDFVLSAGEVLFLPIGCFHYVEGVDISVTVSFTNFVFDNDFSSFYSTFGPV
jgi:Family of unknown function (DUF6065)/Cupin-like domain